MPGYEPLHRLADFEYTTLPFLREEGLPNTISDEKARRLIKQVSERINLVTESFFVPILSIEKASIITSGGVPMVHLDNMVPILDVYNLSIDTSGTVLIPGGNFVAGSSSIVFDSSEYRLDDRFIQLTSFFENTTGPYSFLKRAKFPQGERHIIIDGVFGQLSRRLFTMSGSRNYSTTTLNSVIDGDTSCDVSDATGFKKRDVILFLDDANGIGPDRFAARAIINSVNKIGSPNPAITFDALEIVPGKQINPGATVITWGCVPWQVERAAAILVYRNRFGVATSDNFEENKKNSIISERTDNYDYKLSNSASKSTTSSSSSNSTGDSEADSLLNYVMLGRPPYIGAP